VDYVKQNLLDYPKIVKYPMDFGTVKRKLAFNGYEHEDEFKCDMNLVFDNCILYNGMQSPYGKIAMEMKLEFNTMYLKELMTGM
jgi:bromodomain-containing factor 1